MTIVEAIAKAEEMLGSIPVNGRENVKKMNAVFDILDACIATINQKPERSDEKCPNS